MMKEYKRRVLLGAMVILSLLLGVLAPASVIADTVSPPTPAPDLIIETVTWSPEIPSTGDTVTITVTIKNQGNSQAGSSRVAYYIDDVLQASEHINQIDAGATATKTFTWESQANAQAIKAVTDINDSVAESDETNNDKTYAFSILAPDLIVETLTWTPESPSTGDKVTFSVTIKNQGNIGARCSHVDLQIDGVSRGYRQIQSLEADANATMDFTWNAQEGAHTIKAISDFLNHVSESNETNNIMKITYATAAPDLIISSITWSPATPSESSNVTFTVTIKNQGNGQASPSYVTYYIDDVLQDSDYVSQMIPGATTTRTFEWTTEAGPHTFKAVADVNDRLLEIDETNNEKLADLPVQAPDLIIQNITWSPSSPLIAHRVTFTVTIKNQGTIGSGPSLLYFYIDNNHIWKQPMPGIAIGDTATTDYHWTPQTTIYAVRAVADGENSVNESNESNNTKTATLTPSGPPTSDLIIQNITWSPENPSTKDTVTFTISIKNKGITQASASHVACYIDDILQVAPYVNEIEPGDTATAIFTWKAQAGSHTIKTSADINHSVTESSESNNNKSVVLSITAPDLVIKDIIWAPVNPSIGNTVTFTVTIKNQGNFSSDYSYIAYYIDDSSRGYHNIKNLDPGATATSTFKWTAQAGSHTIKVVADMEKQIPESNESNNEKLATIPAPDLIIDAITWAPDNPSENNTVTFDIMIKNQGIGRAGDSSVYFQIDDSLQGQENIQELDAGAIAKKTFIWTAQAGSHTFKAIADGENQFTENDEYNNEKTVTLSVSLPVSDNTTTAPSPEPTPTVETKLEKPEADAGSEEAPPPPDKDIVSKIAEKPSSAPASGWQKVWLGWWLILAAVPLGCIASIVILRHRQKPHN